MRKPDTVCHDRT